MKIKRPFGVMLAAVLLGEVMASFDISIVIILIGILITIIVNKTIKRLCRCEQNTTKRFFVVFFLFLIIGYLVTSNALSTRDRVWGQKSDVGVYNLRVSKISDASYGYCVALEKRSERYLLELEDKPTFKIGQVISIKGRIRQFDQARNYGNFSTRDYYMSQGIYARIDGDVENVARSDYDGIRQYLFELKEFLKSVLSFASNDTGFSKGSANENKNTIFQGILLGDKTEIDSEIKDLYSTSGIAHILAISGLHISFIGMSVYRLLRKKFGFVLSGTVAFSILVLFCIMSGMGMATIRALIMFGLKLLGEMLGRVYDALSAMSLAGVVLIIWNPFIIYHQGFVLSFAAIFGIAYIWPKIQKIMDWSKRDNKVREEKNITPKEKRNRYLNQIKTDVVRTFAFSVHVTVFIAPLIAYYYFEIPTFSFLLNIIVVPLMSIVVFTALLSVVSGALLVWMFANSMSAMLNISSIVLYPGSLILELYEMLCRLVRQLPANSVVVGRISVWHIMIYYAVYTVIVSVILHRTISIKRRMAKNQKLYVAYGRNYEGILKAKRAEKTMIRKYQIILVLVIAGLYGSIYAWGICKNVLASPLEACFLDVGQGDGISLSLKKRDIVNLSNLNICVDGGSTTVKNVGKYRVVPYLKAKGISVIDYQFVTHGDEDHLSGVREILENNYMHIKNLVVPYIRGGDPTLEELKQLAIMRGSNVSEIKAGDKMQVGDCKIECLHPSSDLESDDKNNYSIVLSVTLNKFSMLLTGDLTSEFEGEVASRIKQKYNVLKVAHHGSKYSSSSDFLKSVSPGIGILSSGKGNRYGHPTPEVMERLKDIGCKYERTDISGGITIKSNGTNLFISKNIK